MFSKELSKRLVEMGVKWDIRRVWYPPLRDWSENFETIPFLTLEVALSREFLEQLEPEDSEHTDCWLSDCTEEISREYCYNGYAGAEKVLWDIIKK